MLEFARVFLFIEMLNWLFLGCSQPSPIKHLANQKITKLQFSQVVYCLKRLSIKVSRAFQISFLYQVLPSNLVAF